MAIIVDEEQDRKELLELLDVLGVKLPPATKLSRSNLDTRLSKALDCAQRQSKIFGDGRSINIKGLERWNKSMFDITESMLSASFEESTTGNFEDSPFLRLRQIVSSSLYSYYSMTNDNQFFVEDGARDRSIRLKLTGIYVAVEDVAVFSIDFAPGTCSDDDEEGLKLLVTPQTYTLFLKVLELNAARTTKVNQEGLQPGWKSSYILPLGPISMVDIGSLSRNSGCVVCGKKATNVCSGCKLVSYCGKVCQRTDWPHHKSACRSRSLVTGNWVDYRASVFSDNPFMVLINRKDRDICANTATSIDKSDLRPSSAEPFLVKVQINGPDGQDALVYDRKRTMRKIIYRNENPETFQPLADVVKTGYLGLKTYLWAKKTSPDMLSICLDRQAKREETDW